MDTIDKQSALLFGIAIAVFLILSNWSA